jgi:hypothetical protein
MPRPRIYQSNARRQAAYRARRTRHRLRGKGQTDRDIAQALRYLHYALKRAGRAAGSPIETALRLQWQHCPPKNLKPASAHWLHTTDGDIWGLRLYERHYSCRDYKDGRERRLFVGPGEKMVLITPCARAVFVWRKFKDDSGQVGVCCAVFRNEGAGRSSGLILEAMNAAWERWPGERLYTFVDSEAIQSRNPGCCFKMAGWRSAGRTRGGLQILEAQPR